MAIGGTRRKHNFADDFENSEFSAVSEQYANIAKDIRSKEHMDFFLNPVGALTNPNVVTTLENFFVEGSYDPAYYAKKPKELASYKKDQRELFKNDIECITEYTSMSGINPIVTTGLPMHKLLGMKNIFKQGVIQNDVAVEPTFTIKMQHRYLIGPDGKSYDLVLDQKDLSRVFNSINPLRTLEFDLTAGLFDSSKEATEKRIVKQCGGVLGRDNLNRNLKITAIKIAAANSATGADVWVKKVIKFTPQYQMNDMVGFNQPLDLSAYVKDSVAAKSDILFGVMQNNEMVITSAQKLVAGIKIECQLDPSNAMLPTCKAKWNHDETIVNIPNANPINIPISPEEVKDVQALYGVSQLSMYMSIINDVLGNVKDDFIREHLYASYDNMPAGERQFSWFDFEPRETYYSDAPEWRKKSFMDVFDTFTTGLLNVLNDENVTITVLGRQDIIRKITPTDIKYSAPAEIGGVDLEFTRVVATSDRRVYNFISSQKLGDSNDLTVILNPNNSSRIIYRIYDYQFYISNEIRSVDNTPLPGIHAFERYEFLEYQPVQGKFRIFNPSGRNENNAEYTEQLKDLAGLE